MSGKVFQGSHLTIPFTEEGTLKGLEIQGITEQETKAQVDGKVISGEYVNANDVNVETGKITIRGTTEQETISEVAGTTIVGETISATNINNEIGKITIEGVSNQEIREETSGTTVSGENIYINDVNNETGKIVVYGKTTQDFGKNLYKNSDTFEGVDYTGATLDKIETLDGSYSMKVIRAWQGPYLNLQELMEKKGLKVGDVVTYSTYFKLNFIPEYGFSFSLFRAAQASHGTFASFAPSTLTIGEWYRISVTFELTEYSLTANKARIECNYYDKDNAYYFNDDGTGAIWFARPQLEIGSEATEYEPYKEIPSIDYPSKIKNVGDNINLYNKNALGYGNGAADYWKIEENGTITTTANFSHSRDKGVQLFLEKNTDYTVSFVLNSMTFTGTNKGTVEILSYNEDNSTNTQVEYSTFTNEKVGKKITFSFNSGNYSKWALHISGWYGTGNSGTLNYQDVKVEKGLIATEYSEYECGSIGFKKINKNLCKFERTISANASASVEDNKIVIKPTVAATAGVSYIVLSYHEFEIGKKYTVSFKTEGNYRMAGLFSGPWTLDKSWSTSPYSFTLEEGDNTNLALGFYVDNSSISNSLTIYDVQIEENNGIATDYVEHQEEIIVFPLEKGQKLHEGDYLERDGIHQFRKTLIFDGTETYWKVSDTTVTGYSRFAIANIKTVFGIKNSAIDLKCSHFIRQNSSEGNYISDVSSGGYLYFGINNEALGITNDATNTEKLTAWKNWLINQNNSNNPLMLETELLQEQIIPYTSEQKIIAEQLDNYDLYTPSTHITSLGNMKGNLNLRYNYVSALPNSREPREIRNLNNINLFAIEDIEETTSAGGITYSVKDGLITLNGTSTGQHYINLPTKFNLPKGIYTMSTTVVNGSYTGTAGKQTNFSASEILVNGGYLANTVTVTTTKSGTNVWNAFYIGATAVFNNYQIKIKLEKGSIATSYSPYGCGVIDLKVQNKNIFNLNSFTETANGKKTITKLDNGFRLTKVGTNVYGNIFNLDCKSNTEYYFSATGMKSPDCSFIRFVIIYTDGTKTYSAFTPTNGKVNGPLSSISLMQAKQIKTIQPYVQSSDAEGAYFELFDIQIEEGSTSTDYQEHQEQIISFPLEKEQILHEKDYLSHKGISQIRQTTIFDGTETSWMISTDVVKEGVTRIAFRDAKTILGIKLSTETIKCSHFQYAGNNSGEYISDKSSANIYIGIDNRTLGVTDVTDNATKLAAWKEWLVAQKDAQTPLTIEYDLQKEIIIPYTEEQQLIKNQLDKYQLYLPTTYMHTIGDDKAKLNLEYGFVRSIPNLNDEIKIDNLGNNINLFNKNLENVFKYGNGADRTIINEDGSYTTTSNYSSSRNQGTLLELEKNKDYIVSLDILDFEDTTNTITRIEILGYNENDTVKATIKSHSVTGLGRQTMIFNSGDYAKWALHISAWNNYHGVTFGDIKVEKDLIATAYSEYNCGNVDIKIQNKNLANTDIIKSKNAGAFIDITSNSFTIDLSQGSLIAATVDSFLGELDPNEQYTLSYKFKQNNNVFRPNIRFFYTDGTSSAPTVQNSVNEEQNLVVTSVLGKTIERISVAWNTQSEGGIAEFWDIQLEKGNAKTSFIEHEEQNVVFPFTEGQFMYEGSYLALDGIHHKRKRVIFDGTEEWGQYNRNLTEYFAAVCHIGDIKSGDNNTARIYCNKLIQDNNKVYHTNGEAVSSLQDEYIYISLRREDIGATKNTPIAECLTLFKQYLADCYTEGKPFIVEYPLLKEVSEPYTAEQEEIARQLNKYTLFTPAVYISTINKTKGSVNLKYNYIPALPNPENPQTIRNLGDNINLFNKNNFNELSCNLTSGKLTYHSEERTLYFKCEKNTTYSFQKLIGTNFRRMYVSETTEFPAIGVNYQNNKDMILNTPVYTTTDTAEYIVFWYYCTGSDLTKQEILDSIKIEKNSIISSYTPYNQGSIDIRITNENLFSGALGNGVKGNNGGLSYTDVNIYRYVDILLPVGTYKYKQFDTANFRLIRQVNLTMKQDLKSSFTLSKPCVVSFTFRKADNTQWDLGEDASVIPFMLSKSDTDNSTLVQAKSQTVVLPLIENQLLHEGDEIRSDGIYTTKKTVTITDEDFLKYHGSAEVIEDGLIHWSCWGGLPTLGGYWTTTPITKCSIYGEENFLKWGTLNNAPQPGIATYTGQVRVITENVYGILASDTTNERREKVANWLKENKVTLELKLDEPVLVPYTSEQSKIINNLPVYAPSTNIYVINDSTVQIVANSGDFVPVPRTELIQVLNEEPNLGTRVNLEIWSHEDEFIDTLYNTDYEFEGQCIDPKITLNANGSKTLTLSLPLYIIDKKTREFVENPRWTYITQQYKIRVQQDDRINEFVLRDYTESHDANDQLIININAQSLEEFELSQIGYNITFNENSLYRYNTNEDPNDPDTVPIGTYEPDIHFWNEKLLENSDWEYRVESYYPIDREMSEDNRQITNEELEYKNGKEQFYEEDRIIDYTEENEPIYSEEYEIKKRVVKAEKSNIFNIVQDICEAFECWPTFEIQYKDGKIVKKTIVYKNDVPQDATFSVNYQTNLNSIQRTVDSSQIVTKMYVTPIQNENVDNGIISISTNPKNFMKENYLLDLSWYLGDDRAETDIRNARLINPKIGMHFAGTNFSEPLFTTTDTETTKDTIEVYKKNIRNRNTYIENMSLQLSKDQEELINLKTEREYVQSQKDAAQETVNTLIDEMSLIGNTELRKENKACYLYKQNDTVIIRFSEIGIKTVPNAETFNTPINILALDGTPFYEEGKVPAGTTNWKDIKTLQLVPYKVDPIIGTILECQVVNATIGTSTDSDYASFKCSFDYDPYDYYKKLISYWNAKIVAATDRLNLLGKSREDGGNSGLIYDLETKVIEEKRYVFQAQQQKAQVVKEFESKFNPYIREGYWENTDFGIYMNKEQSKTYIPNEFKVLKYGQTEDSSSEETDKYDWSKDYVSFKIPNVLISNAQGGTAYLYNIIDIEEIEVMNDDPLNKNDNFRTYVKGTDYSLEYGYTSLTPNVTASDRGIYIRFYEPEVNTNNDYIPQFTANSQVYIRVKARGSNQYIWSGYSKAEYQSEGNETKRKWFCPLEQRISIDDKDIILSSIVVKANTSKVTYDNNNNLIIDNTQYELKYGKDYYTSKEIENGVTLSRITFYQTTNTPLMDFQYANYTVEYNQDITAKYYYNDALDVMKDSSIPQTTYSINVLDISEAENFLSNLKWYKPQVGTRVPIYDEELRFKGLVGFINSITFDLLNPQNTQLSITNFKDKFVDLFQKITASTIALQSKEYEYDRSTQIVTVEGGISKNVLKDTFERPDSNFTVTPNSNIKWDYSGITSTSDKLNENGVYAQLKVTPKGIFTANSKDEFGNYVWTTAITPQGINASQLTIGKLDTRQIQIFNSSEPRFMWNETGLYAYGQNEGKTDYETYVLYNENGIKFRQLMKSTNRVILPNIVKSPTFTTLSDWTLSSTDGSVFDTSNTGIVEEIEVVGASGIPTYQAIVASNKQTNNITFTLNSTKKDLVREHKYYFRVYVKANNIPELTNIDMNAGFTSFFKNIQYSQNNQYAKIDGFVTGVTDDNKFAINVTLPNGISNWSVSIKKPMILDVTEIFGETIPSLQWFSDLTDIVEEGSWETDLDVYGDALRLDWGGLRIGAQDNSLQLTSQDGLVIYHPITTETNNERRMRLQLGQWKEVAVDEFGNPITNGTELMYEDLYGLRALDNNGNMIFKVTQRGVEFDFTSNLEETIKNYSAEAALGAIASTNTSNLLKNSCGYVYDAEIVDGKETGLYTKFYDWDVENINYLFPVDTKFTQKNADGSESSIVEGTVSKHAFKMGGDTATSAKPVIKQTVDVATSEGVIQPFTLKFLMKGISNTQTSSIKNGIHLEITEAGNQDDISVDIPYIGNGNWQVVKYTIYTEMRQVTISISNISTITVDSNNIPTNGVIYLSDLMFTSGKDTPAWTVSPGEVYNNYVTIGSEGVIVTSEKDSAGSSVRTVMDSHSFRVETINADRDISTNIQVTGDSTTLGPTHIKGQCDIGAVSRLRFIENADLEVAVENRNPGVDITLIKG